MVGYGDKSLATAERFFLSSADLWVREVVLSAQATVDVTAGSPTTLVATYSGSPFQGLTLTGGKLVVAGEEWTITGHTASTVDASRAEATSLQDGTHQTRVLSPLRFFGYSEGKSFSVEDDWAEYRTGVPRTVLARDLLERKLSLSGSLVMSGDAQGAETLARLLGLSVVSTSPFRAVGGSEAVNRPYCEAVLRAIDRSGKTSELTLYYGQFEASGEVAFDGDEYRKVSFRFVAYADPLRPAGSNLLFLSVES